MTSDRELEALAEAIYATANQFDAHRSGLPAGYGDWADEIARDLRNHVAAARRLQPARVPEFTSDDLPESRYKILGSGTYNTRPFSGYRGCDVIDAVNEWARRHLLAAAPSAESVIPPDVADRIKGRIDSLSPANNLSRFLDHPAPPTAEPGDGGREGVDVEELASVAKDIRAHCNPPNPESDDEVSATYALHWADRIDAAIASAQQAGSTGEFGEQFIDGMGWVIPMRNAIKYATYIANGAANELAQRTGSRGEGE